jgi:hypothetical protein
MVMELLEQYRGKQGLYIIRPKSQDLLIDICNKLGYEYNSEIAYIGKAEHTKHSDLRVRAKQEMGYANFEGATFVRKMGRYLDFDIRDKRNKEIRDITKNFILDNFFIECVVLEEEIQSAETFYIKNLRPCLNDKKINK